MTARVNWFAQRSELWDLFAAAAVAVRLSGSVCSDDSDYSG